MSVKIIKKRGIDVNALGTKRELGFEVYQLDYFFKDCKTRNAPIQTPTITTMPEDMKPKPLTDEELMLPFIGDDGEYIWSGTDKFPKLIGDMCKVAKNIFCLGKEINGYNVRVFPPASKKNHKHKTHIHRVPYEAAMAIGARVIFPVGSIENFKVKVSASKTQCGDGELKLSSSEALMIGVGMTAGVDFTYDDSNTIEVPQRKGFRKTNIKKNPMSRYVVVIDFINDASVISSLIKKEANINSGGDDTKSKLMEDHTRRSMGIASINDIANEAKAEGDSLSVDLLDDLNSLDTSEVEPYVDEAKQRSTPFS